MLNIEEHAEAVDMISEIRFHSDAQKLQKLRDSQHNMIIKYKLAEIISVNLRSFRQTLLFEAKNMQRFQK